MQIELKQQFNKFEIHHIKKKLQKYTKNFVYVYIYIGKEDIRVFFIRIIWFFKFLLTEIGISIGLSVRISTSASVCVYECIYI
jgi:hypothetical protein